MYGRFDHSVERTALSRPAEITLLGGVLFIQFGYTGLSFIVISVYSLAVLANRAWLYKAHNLDFCGTECRVRER